VRKLLLPLPTRSWWIKTLTINAVIVIIMLGAIQLIPVNRHNPPIRREVIWDAPETEALARQACFDCHSNQTEWPWYSKIAPASWIIWYDVSEGREKMDFSDWDRFAHADYVDPNDAFPPKTLSERIAEVVRSGRMPPGTYRLANPDARLTDAEKEALIAGLVRTVQQNQDKE
jgi:hypothetical protein